MTSLNRRSFFTIAAAAGIAGPRAVMAQDATPTTSGPISVEDANGTFTLEQAPERIVALEWSLVENALALGVQPVGIADLQGYHTWVSVPLELSDDVADVGGQLEPSLESIAALEPDLILTLEGRQAPVHDALSEIAPTLVVPSDDASDDIPPLEANYDRFRLVAAALGRGEMAEPIIDEVKQTIADGAVAIEEAGRSGEPFVVVYAYTAQNVPTMTIFSNNSQLGKTISELGLTNAWTAEGDQYGTSVVTVEALVDVANANFFYIALDTDNIFEQQLADDPIWNSLAFVQEGRIYELGGDTWTYGGPRSLDVIVERTLAAFLSGSDTVAGITQQWRDHQ